MASTLNGSSFALARWFGPVEDVNGASGDFVREEILNEVYQGTRYGVRGQRVIVETPNGMAIVERKEISGCPVVTFDFVRNDRWTRQQFWMNLSSVLDLSNTLRKLPRVSFDELFVGAK